MRERRPREARWSRGRRHVGDQPPIAGVSSALLRAVRRLALDAATAEAVRALRERGTRAILLKGPVIAGWLYADPAQRGYGDIDLLVAPDDFPAAEGVLAGLGYQDAWLGMRAHEAPQHERLWLRAAPPSRIDLHRSLAGPGAESSAVWAALSEGTESMNVCGEPVDVLGLVPRTLLVALHAAQHGAGTPQPIADLELAVAQVDRPVWAAAAELAAGLDASESFAAGLRLVSSGRALAADLGLSDARSAEVRLRASNAPPTAIGFARMRESRSARGQIGFLLAKLFPSPQYMRYWVPLARRGRLGLLCTYAYRPFRLAGMAPRGWVASRRASRSASDS